VIRVPDNVVIRRGGIIGKRWVIKFVVNTGGDEKLVVFKLHDIIGVIRLDLISLVFPKLNERITDGHYVILSIGSGKIRYSANDGYYRDQYQNQEPYQCFFHNFFPFAYFYAIKISPPPDQKGRDKKLVLYNKEDFAFTFW
jgi:hypothetical protein